MSARKLETTRSAEELVELGPEAEAELERALVEADEAERKGTLVPWETYFAERRRRVG